MSISQRPDSFELADYLGVLRRRWGILLTVTILCVVGSAGYLYAAPKVYSASAEISVTPTGAGGTQQSTGAAKAASPVNMDNEAQLVQSLTVATGAAKILNSPLTPQALSKQVAVTVPANSQILQISCKTSSASGAAECANAFASSYLANRQATAAASVAGQLRSLQRQINTVTRQAATLTARIANLPVNSQQRAVDQALYSSYSSQLRALSNQAATLTGEGANSTGGSVIGNASPPSAPSSPRKLLILPSGLLVGLLLALLIAFFADRRDKRIHGTEEAERALDAPVLLNLAQRKANVQFGLLSPRSRAGHGITELARGIAASLGNGNHVIFVTSASSGAAAAMTGVNLAASLARTYSDTILVTPNQRGSLAPQMLGLDDGHGLVELLAGTATFGDVARRPADIPRLRVITPGVESAIGTTDFQFDAVASLVTRLRAESRYVIIEAAGGEGSTDAFAFAEFADAAVIVLEASRTTAADAMSCARRLDQVHTTLLGSVLISPVDAPPKLRNAPAAKVRPLPDRSPQRLPEMPAGGAPAPGAPAPGAPAAGASAAAARRRPASRHESRPQQDVLRRAEDLLGPAEEAPASSRPPRDLSQTRPFPRPSLPPEEEKPKQRPPVGERQRRAADTGTG